MWNFSQGMLCAIQISGVDNRTDPPTDRSDTRLLIMNHSNETNFKIICSTRQNQYHCHSIPSLG